MCTALMVDSEVWHCVGAMQGRLELSVILQFDQGDCQS